MNPPGAATGRHRPGKLPMLLLLAVLLAMLTATSGLAQDVCHVCGQPILNQGYLITDDVTGQRELVCSNCAFNLPRCYLCGLPIKAGDEVRLPDGRYLCARDASTAVMDADTARATCAGVKDDLDRLFSRFTTFPTNVDVAVIDRIDAETMFHAAGHDFESPDLLGCITRRPAGAGHRYQMSLMTGLPLAELKETCAHEYSHAWVGENVPPQRHARIDRDAEEGFCEMVGYLLMDDQGEEAQKARVLKNQYTRGQVQQFIAAEQTYGFEDVLDWMRSGVTSRLEAGHLEEIREVQTPAADTAGQSPPFFAGAVRTTPSPARSARYSGLQLQGVIWGSAPAAIINGRSFMANDTGLVPVGGTNETIRCERIEPARVVVFLPISGRKQALSLPAP